jgi:hypothetical protein
MVAFEATVFPVLHDNSTLLVTLLYLGVFACADRCATMDSMQWLPIYANWYLGQKSAAAGMLQIILNI